jgi:hypothetical protein
MQMKSQAYFRFFSFINIYVIATVKKNKQKFYKYNHKIMPLAHKLKSVT